MQAVFGAVSVRALPRLTTTPATSRPTEAISDCLAVRGRAPPSGRGRRGATLWPTQVASRRSYGPTPLGVGRGGGYDWGETLSQKPQLWMAWITLTGISWVSAPGENCMTDAAPGPTAYCGH